MGRTVSLQAALRLRWSSWNAGEGPAMNSLPMLDSARDGNPDHGQR